MPRKLCRHFVILQLCVLLVDSDHIFLNQFAIQLKDGNKKTAEDIAQEYGFLVKSKIECINAFILEHSHVLERSKRSADSQVNLLKRDTRIQHVHQEVVLHRVKRQSPSLTSSPASSKNTGNIYRANVSFSDPKFKDMWYLVNRGQNGNQVGLDINTGVVWQKGWTGQGIVVSILDDGIDHKHPDLIDNYDQRASTDLNDRNDPFDDPMPDKSSKDNSHGTRCAGEVAATANNNVCGVGVAYEASIGGIRLLDGVVTDGLEAEALTFNNDYIDIYSASWGPRDDGIVMAGPGHLASQALQYGAQHGRRGLGSIFVWATGNGGLYSDNCNADGYVSRPETFAVGAINDSGKKPFYTENCTSILVVVPSSVDSSDDGQVKSSVITTDINDGCLDSFQGTSSAAPLAAGCIANVLQSNPSLTWRDIQHIAVLAARIPSSSDHSWTINGAGHHVSHQFGFGLMDCGHMVHLAQSWRNVPEQIVCQFHTPKVNRKIPMSGSLQDTVTMEGCQTTMEGYQTDQLNTVDQLEHVQVTVNMFTHLRGDISITLISPALTRSQLLAPRPNDSFSGDWTFTFMTVHSWGESPVGEWTLQIESSGRRIKLNEETSQLTSSNIVKEKLNKITMEESESLIYSWNLILWGTLSNNQSSATHEKNTAFQPTQKYIEEIVNKESERSHHIFIKENKKDVMKPSNSKFSVERDDSIQGAVLENTDIENVQKRMLHIKNKHLDNELDEIETLTDDITQQLTKLLDSN